MRRAGNGERLQPIITANAMILMHQQVTHLNAGGIGNELVGALLAPRRPGNALAQQILLGADREIIGDKTALQAQQRHPHHPRGQPMQAIGIGHDLSRHPILGQHMAQPLGRAARPGRHHVLSAA